MDDVAGLLATLAGMAAIIAVGAVQLRRPAVSHVEVTDVDGETRLVVRLPAWDAIWAMKRSVTEGDDMLPILNQPRSDIPAVTHVDYSARVQTVGADANPEFRRLLKAFHAKTGCPVLVNTSFNVRGEPIVCTPQDAYRCFMRTGMDLLVVEDRLLWKHEQPVTNGDETWKQEYEPD